MQKRVIAALASATLGLTACGVGPLPLPSLTNPGAGIFAATPSKAGQAKWTVLVHLAADNNLYDFGLEDINEMEAGLNNKDVNVIVLFDGDKQGDSCIYQIVHDPAGKNAKIISKKLDDKGAVIPSSHEIDSGDAKTSAKFATWAIKNFPADKYAMFFWDHGSGIFKNNARSFVSKGFCWDDNGHNMTTADLRTVLGAAVTAAGKPLEAFGFDCCLMSHVEMAYQAKGLANYMVASEELEPGKGWDYVASMKALSANPDWNGGQFGKAIVDAYAASYQPGGSQSENGEATNATLACTNVNALVGNFVPALNSFATTLTAAYPKLGAQLDDVRSQSATFDNTDCADLGNYLSKVKASNLPDDIKASAAAVEAARAQAVVAHGEAGSPEMHLGTGLVLYFPRKDQSYNSVYSDPSKIAFGAEGWKNYLLAAHQGRVIK